MIATQMKATLQLELLARLAEARVRTDELFKLVAPDSFYERPIPERHRIVFYLGHVEAFDWNLLHKRVLNRLWHRPCRRPVALRSPHGLAFAGGDTLLQRP